MRPAKFYRVAALVVAFAGIILNFLAAAQLLTLWLNFRWELDSEWEWLGDRWRIDGVKLIGGVLCAYSAFAGAVSAIGLAGVIKVGSPLCTRYLTPPLTPSVEQTRPRAGFPRLLYCRLLVLHILRHHRRICGVPHDDTNWHLRRVLAAS